MRGTTLAMTVSLAVALMFMLSAMPVGAEAKTVSGTMSQVSSETLWTKTAGPNKMMMNHNFWSASGDLQGQLESQPRVMILASGEVLVIEWATFSGSWGDLEGTLTIRDIGSMVGPGLFHLDSEIARGTGDFAGAYGWGSIDVDMSTLTASYSFELYWQ